MTKKTKSTYDEFVESLSPKEKKAFDNEFKELVLSELVLAMMARDEVSVRQLAKLADVSPTVVQAMRSGTKKDFSTQSFFKILRGLGCKRLMIDFNGQLYPLDISQQHKAASKKS
jgi:hypothetical protein